MQKVTVDNKTFVINVKHFAILDRKVINFKQTVDKCYNLAQPEIVLSGPVTPFLCSTKARRWRCSKFSKNTLPFHFPPLNGGCRQL